MRGDYILYLKVGDQVYHKRYINWGLGVVVEERRSELPGGFCYVRVCFQDGKTRVFDNNFKSNGCCYYAGIEKIEVTCEIKEEKKQNKKKAIENGQRTRKLKG